MLYRPNVLILGKGGFGSQLGEFLRQTGDWDKVFYLDDNAPGCVGKLRDYCDPEIAAQCTAAFVGIGNNALRVELLQKLAKAGYQTPFFVHASAVVSPSAHLGAGTVVLPFAFVGAGAGTGTGCIVNTGSILDHDAVLGDGVHAAPGTIIKAGAVVGDCIKIESGEVVASPWETKQHMKRAVYDTKRWNHHR